MQVPICSEQVALFTPRMGLHCVIRSRLLIAFGCCITWQRRFYVSAETTYKTHINKTLGPVWSLPSLSATRVRGGEAGGGWRPPPTHPSPGQSAPPAARTGTSWKASRSPFPLPLPNVFVWPWGFLTGPFPGAPSHCASGLQQLCRGPRCRPRPWDTMRHPVPPPGGGSLPVGVHLRLLL